MIDIEKYNKIVVSSKIGLQLLFDEMYGSSVTFNCKFDRLGFDKETNEKINACVNSIFKDGKFYLDVDEKGQPVSHLWFAKVASPKFNKFGQDCLWRSLSKGDNLILRGNLWYYDNQKTRDRKLCIVDPIIIQINNY